jgi:hypothetical protein
MPMKILRPSTNHLKNRARKNLALAILCAIGSFILIYSSIPNLPIYIDLGSYDAVRGGFSLIPFIVGVLYWRQYKAYKLGYEGEKHVTERLKSALPEEFCLINDVVLPPYDRGNIDHIVLSPRGIFAIETKNHRGRITCYGDEWIARYRGKNRGASERELNFTLGSPSAQARNNALRLKKIIDSLEPLKSKKIWVQGIVVFPNKYAELKIFENPDSVKVMKLDELPKYLINYDEGKQLSPEELDLIGKEILRQAE